MPERYVMWVIIAILTSAIPLPLLKRYLITKNIGWVVLSCIAHIILIFAYIQLLEHTDMETMYAFIKIISMLAVFIFGVLIFETPLNKTTMIGLLFGCISLYLLIPSQG
jgi:multidrug transporter EmrE-like cation transporter